MDMQIVMDKGPLPPGFSTVNDPQDASKIRGHGRVTNTGKGGEGLRGAWTTFH